MKCGYQHGSYDSVFQSTKETIYDVYETYRQMLKQSRQNRSIMKPVQGNEPFSSLLSFVGFLLSIVALMLLVIDGVRHGKTIHIVGFSIFGAGLILLYLTSTIYHLISTTHWTKSLVRKIDHAMIYVLIASTYTPIMLVLPQREWRWGVLSLVWSLALVGIVKTRRDIPSTETLQTIPLRQVKYGAKLPRLQINP